MTGAEKEWIEWAGGECPVDGDTPVQVKSRHGDADGCRYIRPARHWRWFHAAEINRNDDIIAYRVVQS